MKIVTYNVNGIRAAINKGLFDWVETFQPDILCIQETKAQPEQVELDYFTGKGYSAHWHSAEKKGYSGVLTLSKVPVEQCISGCGFELYDSEGRIIRTDFQNFTLLNCYFPSGTSGEVRQDVKMRFLEDFYQWINTIDIPSGNLIVVGDYNIAHTEIDIHNPVSNKNTSGFLPEERAWMSKWFESGFIDSYRYLNPTKVEYSWWSYRAGARKNNKGWRIDYISVSSELKDKLKSCYHLGDAMHSDHCPVFLEINI